MFRKNALNHLFVQCFWLVVFSILLFNQYQRPLFTSVHPAVPELLHCGINPLPADVAPATQDVEDSPDGLLTTAQDFSFSAAVGLSLLHASDWSPTRSAGTRLAHLTRPPPSLIYS